MHEPSSFLFMYLPIFIHIVFHRPTGAPTVESIPTNNLMKSRISVSDSLKEKSAMDVNDQSETLCIFQRNLQRAGNLRVDQQIHIKISFRCSPYPFIGNKFLAEFNANKRGNSYQTKVIRKFERQQKIDQVSVLIHSNATLDYVRPLEP